LGAEEAYQFNEEEPAEGRALLQLGMSYFGSGTP